MVGHNCTYIPAEPDWALGSRVYEMARRGLNFKLGHRRKFTPSDTAIERIGDPANWRDAETSTR